MTSSTKLLQTRAGSIDFPTYIPVTTFGKKYPLDNLIRPYLPRLSQAIMVSYYYAQQMEAESRPDIPVLVDSGGFASLFANAKVKSRKGLGVIELETDEGKEVIHPYEVIEFQESVADVAFTLDFPIPPKMELKDARRRQKLTISNALWALANRHRRDMPLYACLQAWNAPSARESAIAYQGAGFDGVAIGGLVPRARNADLVKEIVSTVRDQLPGMPLHVFGLGNPDMVSKLYELGVDSVDSSSYVKLAAQGKLWGTQASISHPSPTERMHLALCNLATAAGRALPLSTHNMAFRSRVLAGL